MKLPNVGVAQWIAVGARVRRHSALFGRCRIGARAGVWWVVTPNQHYWRGKCQRSGGYERSNCHIHTWELA